MKILFVYTVQKSLLKNMPLKGQEDIQMGIAQMSALLKKNNYPTDLLLLDKKNKKSNYKIIDDKFQSNKFDIVAFSSVFSEINYITEIAGYIKKKYDIFTILGGVHVTISPEERFLDIFDTICIGEGENALLELTQKLEKKEDITSIQNLWFKRNGKIIRNQCREFIQNLDELPFVDRDLWQPYILNKNTRLTVLLGRGCPYNCTYCCNHKLKKVAGGKYVRLRSPENIVSELEYLSNRFSDITEYFLEIETLGADLKWLIELCEQLYNFNKKRETKLSFGANLRVYDNLNFDIVFESLKKANFESIIIGLESGNERIRKEILNRHYSNHTIIKAVTTARKSGIKVGVFNLIGLPTESYQDFLDTLEINQKIQPDWHATSIFFPYKGTELYNKAEEIGILPKNLDFTDERQRVIMDLPEFRKKQIQKQFDSFHYNVYKKAKKRSKIKLILFMIQTILGHNFMANTKNKLIILLYRFKIKNTLVQIIQKN